MFPSPNSPVPANPRKNSTAATMSDPLTPIFASICDPTTAPMQNVIIMILNVSATAALSRPNAEVIGPANIENA